ncbi:MAG: penicillin-binding transpeptidase domain-containing protein [Clostridia bacterium]
MKNKNLMINGRLIFSAFFLLSCICIAVPVALYFKQIVNYDKYVQLAMSQQTSDKIIEPERGTIYDTNMKELAVSASVEQVNVDPQIIQETKIDIAALKLSEILELDYNEVYTKLTKNTQYEVIAKEVEKSTADEVRAMISENGISGISLVPDTKRYYPQGNLASNLIGFTGTDGYGLEGIEAYYNKTLSGTPGRIISATDAQGGEMPFEYEQYIEAQNGNSIVLTIDEVIQYYLEKHLETAMEDNNPKEGVSGIIMDVKTGEILAMATKPDYDLNEPFVIQDEGLLEKLEPYIGTEEYSDQRKTVLTNMWRNKPVVDSYEPGSTFKLLTVAMAYEESLVDEYWTHYCTGQTTVADWTIGCWKDGGHGTVDLIGALENSCNPALIALGLMVGTETFMDYYELFGFTEKTNIDLSGETSGVFFTESNFNQVELAVSSFGQTFQITPLQLITAVSAVVNDGYMVQPHVVKEVIDEDGKVVETTSTETIRQIVSEETSEFMRSAMQQVVTTGTAKNAYVAGYRVGGKTATSQKRALEITTGESHYIASFIGVAPMDDPQIAVLIMIDEPQGALTQGGQIAAPVVGRIMADVLPYIGVEAVYTDEELASIDVSTPNLVGATLEQVEDNLSSQALSYRTVGEGTVVTDQVPAPDVMIPSSATMILYMGEEKPTETITVPNILGKSASQAKSILEANGLYLKASGVSALVSGTSTVSASKQSPSAGQQVTLGTIISVEFTDTSNVSDA